MKTLEEKLNLLRETKDTGKLKVMIIGLGSVGTYLLDYILSSANEQLEVCVVGRSMDKMISDVNIVKVASMIRGQNRSKITVEADVDCL